MIFSSKKWIKKQAPHHAGVRLLLCKKH